LAASDLDLMRRAYDALVSGDIPLLFSLMDDDVAAHVPGWSQVAGEYAGKQAVLGYVATLGELSGGTLRFELHDVLTGDGQTGHGHAVALVKDLAERADGRSLAMNNVHVWHVGDGRLREIWVYPGDLNAWDDFWS
jgi:ketosteroid isomerase-like protein